MSLSPGTREATSKDVSATPVIEAQAPTVAKAEKKGKRTVECASLAGVFAGYLRSLEEAGKSDVCEEQEPWNTRQAGGSG